MAINTGAQLASAVADWLARADLTASIPNCVQLAEASIFRKLRTPEMLTKDAAFSITGEYVAVPTGFLEVRSFFLNNSTKDPLSFMDPDTMVEYFGTASNTPKYFAVVGGNFQFGPVPDATYTATLTYYKAPATCSTGGSETNWLLTAYPDVYLWGTLAVMSSRIQDDPRVEEWLQRYALALEQLQSQGNRMQWGGNGMAIRTA